MALYERYVDGVKVARAFTVDGTDEDAAYAALAAAGVDGWQATKPKSARTRKTTPKEA